MKKLNLIIPVMFSLLLVVPAVYAEDAADDTVVDDSTTDTSANQAMTRTRDEATNRKQEGSQAAENSAVESPQYRYQNRLREKQTEGFRMNARSGQ